MSDTNKQVTHFNVYDLSKRWKLAPKTLDRWRQRGVGPRFLKIGGHVMYRKEDIETYEEACLKSTTEKDMGEPL
jgi:hypothetical protein